MSGYIYSIELYDGLDTPEKLGSYLARTIDHVKANALPFVRCDKAAQNYLQKHNGALVEYAYHSGEQSER